jgi:phospholipase C
MTSVREALDVVGQAVSIKQLAHQRNASFPLSLRAFVGAPPPGRMLRKVILLHILQQKFDLFFNQRPRPLFKVKLDGTHHGQGKLTVLQNDLEAEGGYKEVKAHDFTRDELDIDIPVPSDHHFYFADLNSDALTLNLIPEQPVWIEVGLHFETKGPEEIHINNWSDVDLRRFNITVKFRLEPASGKVGLVTFKEWINTAVSIDSIPGYRDIVEGKIKSTVNQKVYDALQENSEGINQLLTRWLVGGDFYVMGVSSDPQSLTIDYIIPPGQLEPFPETPQPPLEPGLLANIDHIVVLMMENRSFDHMLGYLSKHSGRADVDGLRGGEQNPYKGIHYPPFALPDTQFNVSPPHGHEPVKKQISRSVREALDVVGQAVSIKQLAHQRQEPFPLSLRHFAGGPMSGFVAEFARLCQEQQVEVDPGMIMGYHIADRVPVYDALAREFLICQRWFAAHPGPTFCNRFYTLTGRLNRNADGSWQLDNPHGDDFKPVFTKTIFDHLTDHGVSWHYYEHRYCFLRLFEGYTFDDNTYIVDANDPVKGFFASARAGTLPSVSFIDPNFIDEPDGQDNDDGAPANIANGQHLIWHVVDTLVHSPKWNKTLLVITYDEHGGFYDHVNPLLFQAKAKPVSGIGYYGVRVPTFVISPWVDQGKVSNDVFDHTSIAKTIARRFMSANPPDMGERMAAANDLSVVLRSTARQDRPNIPEPPAPVPRAVRTARTALQTGGDDFKELMRAMHARYAIPR